MLTHPCSRRDFLTTLSLGLGGVALIDCHQPPRQSKLVQGSWGSAVNDPGIVRETVSFESGGDNVPALLAYPRARGQYPIVLVIHASWLVEPYVGETVAMLAQNGFVGLAVDLFHFFPKVNSWEEARRAQGPEIGKLIEAEFREPRMVRNLQSGIDYLRTRPFVAPGGAGVIGFCGGGWNALLFGAQSADVGAVVAFYAPVGASDIQHRAPLELAPFIRVPVQYHGCSTDPNAPPADVDRFEAAMAEQKVPFERYTYDATHGFFAYDRTGVFNPEAASLAWERTVRFLHRNTGQSPLKHPLAPPASSETRGERPSSNAGEHLSLHSH